MFKMDFRDQVKILSDRVIKLKDQILTEEATKNAFIMPLMQALGYDVFNPLEVVPEYVTDIGTKKGEKIDYAIFRDNIPTILIECKHWAKDLNLHEGQLLRYFHVSKARFGILTNGINYKFYSDLAEPNKMDEKPFLEFSIIDIKDNHIEELKKFHKSYYNAESIINTASELKYTSEIKQLIHKELNNPTPDFVKYFTRQVYTGMITSKVLELFNNLVKKSTQQYISDLITDRLKTALTKEDEANTENEKLKVEPEANESKIVTTEEEVESYLIIKSILRQKIDYKRIFYRDFQNCFSILLDDSIRKTICRIYFGNKKFIAFLDENKKEIRYELNSIDDIYNYSDLLFKAINNFDSSKSKVEAVDNTEN